MGRMINMKSFFWRLGKNLPACLLSAFVVLNFEGVPSLAVDLNSGTNSPTPSDAKNSIENSVVQISSTVRYTSLNRPWTKEPPTEISGSGVVISGHRILTCAHVVEYASRIQIQDNEGGGKINAQIEAIAPDMDLAILKPEVESFFDTHPEIKISHVLPDIQDSVLAYGYPVGGSSLSITKGIVSRIEFAAYNYPAAGLRIQIDAAINPGNSGGPAVVDGKMIGLAFSYLKETQNIGYIIPSEEIELFLNDIADGHYDGKPSLFGEYQSLANATLRSFLKLNQSTAGIIVEKPDTEDPSYPLKKWDVITRIGDVPLDSMGTVKLNDDVRVFFKYMIQKVVTNGVVPLTIMRDGKEMKIYVPVPSSRPVVIPSLSGTYPSYFIYGPVVFTSATMEFVSQAMQGQRGGSLMGILSASGSSLVRRMDDKTRFEGEQLVVVPCPLFPHQLSLGYRDPSFQVVKSVNGIPIKNLAQLVQVLRDSKSEYITIEFDVRNGQIIVLRRADVNSATEDILTDNDIRSQGSPDMLSIWNSK
jgi:S1-C subfamily serine protease